MPTHQKHPNEKNPIIVMTAASILMYVECLIAAGHNLEDAKEIAIARHTFIGPAARWEEDIKALVWRVTADQIYRSFWRVRDENLYYATIAHTGAKDTWLRRCLWHTLGLWL